MNPLDSFYPSPRSHGQLLPKASLVAMLFAMALSSSGCFWVSRDTAALRNSLLASTRAPWTKTIEVGVGALTLSATRFGLSYVDLEPEARAALQSVRGAEVGVYRLRGGSIHDRGDMLCAADKAMSRRGWDRLVGVVNDRELVAIYIPQKPVSTRDVKVCLAVFNDQQLVVASARSDLEPLLDIALNRPEWKDKHTRAFAHMNVPPAPLQ